MNEHRSIHRSARLCSAALVLMLVFPAAAARRRAVKPPMPAAAEWEIVYIRAPDVCCVRGDLMTLTGDGETTAPLVAAATGIGFDSASFSPDGKFVAVIRFNGAAASLSLISTETGIENASVPIRKPSGTLQSTAWSPDGRFIAFIDRGESGAIASATPSADASPDIFLQELNPATATFIGEPVNLTRSDAEKWGLSWSRDGSRVAMVSYNNTARRFEVFVHTFNASARNIGPGTSITAPLGDVPVHYRAAWSTDSSRPDTIVFQGLDRGHQRDYTDLFWVEVDSGRSGKLVTLPGAHVGELAWSPDGQRIVFSREAPNSVALLVFLENPWDVINNVAAARFTDTKAAGTAVNSNLGGMAWRRTP